MIACGALVEIDWWEADGERTWKHLSLAAPGCRAVHVVSKDRRGCTVSKITKTLDRVLRGMSDANINFDDLRALLRHLGFTERVRGSHHIFTRDGVPEILNLQPRGAQAKPYQVKQVRGVIVTHTLAGEPQEEPPAEESSAEGSGLSTSEESEDGE